MSSTAALISGLVASAATRKTYWLCFSPIKVLFSETRGASSTFIGEKHNQYVFHVAADATKPEIKAAVELMFKTKVKSVQVANVRGKEKRFGRYVGHRRHWKKAYVSLAQGQEISFQAPE